MDVDHIFIFSNNKGEEADELVSAGFAEGSSRIHPGQGTINRKFYFENFFLEVLWVHDKSEINSPTMEATLLKERSQHKANSYSRFGLCLVNHKDTDILFANSNTYQPSYFPKGKEIDILTNKERPQLPWTFRLPMSNSIKTTVDEPIQDKLRVQRVTNISFGVPNGSYSNSFTEHFKKSKTISFHEQEKPSLSLTFDNQRQNKEIRIPSLSLTMKY